MSFWGIIFKGSEGISMGMQSIYDVILKNMTPEGKLAHDFKLPAKEIAPNELRFMPGAKDGIDIFHIGSNNPDAAVNKIVKYLKSDWEKGSNDAQEKIAHILQKQGFLSVADAILNSIREDHKGLDVENMFDYACRLAFQSEDVELVKLGIGLFGLFDFDDEQGIIDRLIVLALYEELTLYVVVAVLNYQNANDILFEIAKKVNGWGKIHTVERLEPETEVIREWILREGCENTVMDAYLGLECANKGNLIGALRRDFLDAELFDSISIIIDALLDEGPVEGISVYEYAAEALQRYLQFAMQYVATIKHLWYILNVRNWLDDSEITNKDELLKMCDSLIHRPSWQEIICEILADSSDDQQFFYAAKAANRVNLDVSELIYNAIMQNPIKCYGYLSMVYQKPEYAKELTKVYEEVLPLDEMAAGMGDFLYAEKFPHEHTCLDFLLQELKIYPKTGCRLVKAALQSPVTRERNGACAVLSEWCQELNQPLQTISPDLYALLNDIAQIEVNSDAKKSMEKLLQS